MKFRTFFSEQCSHTAFLVFLLYSITLHINYDHDHAIHMNCVIQCRHCICFINIFTIFNAFTTLRLLSNQIT